MSNRIPDKPAGRYGVDALVVAIMLSLIAQSAPAWTWVAAAGPS